MTAEFFFSADGVKICDPIVIWKYIKPRCFKRISGANKIPSGVQYFADQKSWKQTLIVEAVFDQAE